MIMDSNTARVMRDDTKLVGWFETFIPNPSGRFFRAVLYIPPTMTKHGRRGTRYCEHKHSSAGLALKCSVKLVAVFEEERGA